MSIYTWLKLANSQFVYSLFHGTQKKEEGQEISFIEIKMVLQVKDGETKAVQAKKIR